MVSGIVIILCPSIFTSTSNRYCFLFFTEGAFQSFVATLKKKMTVAILETSIQIADRLADIITEKAGAVVFKKYYNRNGAVEYLRNPLPGAILLDIRFFGRHADEMIRQLNKKGSTILIVMYQIMDEATQKKLITAGVDHLIDLYHDFEKIPSLIEDAGKIGK
jgi:response regulator RpfG family c-di-GMP phosphodiesterase